MDDEDNRDGDTPPAAVRSEDAELYVVDTGVGWAEIGVRIGHVDAGPYTFSLAWNPLDDIRQFEKDLSAGQVARMLLRGEPGAVDVVASPDEPESWVRLQIWVIDHRDERELDFEAVCPADALSTSMRTRIGFLAQEYGLAPRRTLWQKFNDWLMKPETG